MQKVSFFNNNKLCRTLPERKYIKFQFLIIINYVVLYLRRSAKNFICQKLLNMPHLI